MRLFAAAYATVFQSATVQSSSGAGLARLRAGPGAASLRHHANELNAATFTYSFYDGGVNF